MQHTLLLMTSVGSTLAIILIIMLLLISFFATPVAAICITNLLKPILKIELLV